MTYRTEQNTEKRLEQIDGQLRHLYTHKDGENDAQIKAGLLAERKQLVWQRDCGNGSVDAVIAAFNEEEEPFVREAILHPARPKRMDLHLEKIERDIAQCGKLDIFGVERILEALYKVADGETVGNLQEVLENVKADALAVEAMQDEQDEAQFPVRMQAF